MLSHAVYVHAWNPALTIVMIAFTIFVGWIIVHVRPDPIFMMGLPPPNPKIVVTLITILCVAHLVTGWHAARLQSDARAGRCERVRGTVHVTQLASGDAQFFVGGRSFTFSAGDTRRRELLNAFDYGRSTDEFSFCVDPHDEILRIDRLERR